MSKIKDIIKKILFKRKIHDVFPYVKIGKKTIIENTFNLQLMEKVNGKKYLVVGDYCLVGGRIVFETKEGSLSVGNRSQISGGATVICRSDCVIGDDVIIAAGVLLYDHDSHSVYFNERKNDVIQVIRDKNRNGNPLATKNWDVVKTSPIIIKDKVWIGRNVIVLKGVTIGEGAVIGAGSVVTHDIPAWSLAAGNPARVIRPIPH